MSGMVGRALPPLPGQGAPTFPGQSAPPTFPGQSAPTSKLPNVDFFLPTGVMVSLQVSPTSSLIEIKDQLFRAAKKYPLFTLLKDQGFYNFLG